MVVLSIVGWASYVGIVTMAMASLTAWGEFHGFPKKLARYAAIINELKALQHWWEHLTPVERNGTQKYQDLVQNVERCMASEREGWLSTSQAAKMLAQQLGKGTDDDAAAGDKPQNKPAARAGSKLAP